MTEAVLPSSLSGSPARPRSPSMLANLDWPLVLALALLVTLGLVMVASASVAIAEREVDDALYLFRRQALYALLAAGLFSVVLWVPLEAWRVASGLLLLFCLFLLTLVLIPGLGREVNGSVRWLPLVLFNLQVSEVAKVGVVVYLAGFLVRRGDAVRASFRGFAAPMAVLAAVSALLLAEPDFGAAVVIVATGLVMLFLAGVPLRRLLPLAAVAAGFAALMIYLSPYRWQRLTGFLDPWADPFDSGFQLTQALIAIGRGGWFGVGLGNSVQKLFYLPEAHTDFLFSVLAEELGLAGMAVVIGLYAFVVVRAFSIGARSFAAERPFAGYLVCGIGFWFGFQAFVNMGVNLGLLPTKGLTLPLMSYGGSSLVMTGVALALVVRAAFELRIASMAARARDGEGGHD